jgi:hypothetical protein
VQAAYADDERAGLEKLYQVTGGAQWLVADGWSSATSACTWSGLSCDGGGVVVSIALAGMGLQGRSSDAAAELAMLTAVEVLDLADNGVDSPVPPQLASLTALQRLDYRVYIYWGKPLGVVMFWHNRHCAVGQPL